MLKLEDVIKENEIRNKVIDFFEKAEDTIPYLEKLENKISLKKVEIEDIEDEIHEVKTGIIENFGLDVFDYIFEVSEVPEVSKPSKVYTFENSKNSLFFKITKEFLEGEKSLSVLASKFYEGVKYTKGEKAGTFRVIEGKPDLETISLTGRQIDENENKELLIFKSRSSNSKGKVYAPVIIGITEAGKKVYGDIKIGE